MLLHTSGNDHYRLTMVGIGWQISCEELQKVKLELSQSAFAMCFGCICYKLGKVFHLYTSNLWNISYNYIGTNFPKNSLTIQSSLWLQTNQRNNGQAWFYFYFGIA